MKEIRIKKFRLCQKDISLVLASHLGEQWLSEFLSVNILVSLTHSQEVLGGKVKMVERD